MTAKKYWCGTIFVHRHLVVCNNLNIIRGQKGAKTTISYIESYCKTPVKTSECQYCIPQGSDLD